MTQKRFIAGALLAFAGCLWAGYVAAQPKVPVIFLHGIGGSMLAEKANPEKIYYGNVKETMDRFAKLELPLDRSKDKLVSVDVMRTAQLARGSSIDQYILIIRRLEALGYKEGSSLLLFHYDWRRSNHESADKLRRFIADKGLAGKPVDLIGHSMGGLVSTIYIQKYAGEQKVRNFIAMGTPFFGAVNAIRALIEGFAVFGVENTLLVSAGDANRVYRVFSSMDSLYELLPTYPDCCHMKPDASAPMQEVNLIKTELVWQRFDNFLLEKTGAAANKAFRDRVRKNMAEQRRLVDLPMPANVRFYAVVGKSADRTLIQFQGGKRGVGKPVWGVGVNAGDGTVPAVSALGRVPEANLMWSNRDHQFIFEDDAVWPKLKMILLQ